MPSKPVYSDKYSPCPSCRKRNATLHREIACTGMGYAITCWCGTRCKVMTTEEEAIQAWEDLPREQEWTRNLPTVQGWYWMQYPREFDPCVVYVVPIEEGVVRMFLYVPDKYGPHVFHVRAQQGYEWSSGPLNLPFDPRAATREWEAAMGKAISSIWREAVLTSAEHVIRDMTPGTVRENLSKRDKD